jgi:dienelactone hydrolase
VLADDAVAAMHEARSLTGARAGRVGYQGGSEGGWVVPLAASRTPVDFAIVSFGLAVTILQEDQESVVLDMHFHGFGPKETAKALEVARAAETVIESRGARGYEAFDSLRRRYKSEPWYKYLHGDFMFMVLPLNQVQIKEAVKQFDFQIPFRYEPMPVLEASTTPQLWILGEDDLEAPSAETARRIKSLIDKGRNYTLAVYPNAEHGMTEYELNNKGERVSTRFSPGYFAMMRDFAISGRIGDHYGKAAIARTPLGKR